MAPSIAQFCFRVNQAARGYRGGRAFPRMRSMTTMNPSRTTRFAKLPKACAPVVFAFYMSAIMAGLMCTVIVGVGTGWAPGFAVKVVEAYLLAMPTAFLCVLAVRPVVVRLVGWTVR